MYTYTHKHTHIFIIISYTNNHNGWIYIWPSLSGLLPLTSGEQTKQIIVPADDLGRQLEEIVAEHENDMVRIDEKLSKYAQNIAKLENDFLAASEKQAKVNEVVDERLQKLELMIRVSFYTHTFFFSFLRWLSWWFSFFSFDFDFNSL